MGTHLGLVLEVLSKSAFFKIPGFHKSIFRASHKHFPISREDGALRTGRLAKFDFPASLLDRHVRLINRRSFGCTKEKIIVRFLRENPLIQSPSSKQHIACHFCYLSLT